MNLFGIDLGQVAGAFESGGIQGAVASAVKQRFADPQVVQTAPAVLPRNGAPSGIDSTTITTPPAGGISFSNPLVIGGIAVAGLAVLYFLMRK